MANEVLDNLDEIGLGDHAVEEVEGAQTDRLVLVLQTGQDEVLVRLDALRVVLQDLVHRQEAQVLHCKAKANAPNKRIITLFHDNQTDLFVGVVWLWSILQMNLTTSKLEVLRWLLYRFMKSEKMKSVSRSEG